MLRNLMYQMNYIALLKIVKSHWVAENHNFPNFKLNLY